MVVLLLVNVSISESEDAVGVSSQGTSGELKIYFVLYYIMSVLLSLPCT